MPMCVVPDHVPEYLEGIGLAKISCLPNDIAPRTKLLSCTCLGLSSNNVNRKLEGSCQCGGVEFTLDSSTPVPYQLCACSICRKIGGHIGAVNLGGIAESLEIKKGKGLIKQYSAIKARGTKDEERCSSERNFCSNCGTMLWLWDKTWPELIHPFASAIDTELPTPDELVCIFEDSKPAWAQWPEGKKRVYKQYPELSLEDWHKKHGLFFE